MNHRYQSSPSSIDIVVHGYDYNEPIQSHKLLSYFFFLTAYDSVNLSLEILKSTCTELEMQITYSRINFRIYFRINFRINFNNSTTVAHRWLTPITRWTA